MATAIEDEWRFSRLAKQWRDETGHHSNWAIIKRHPNYAEMIAFGRDAIPLVLQIIRRGDYSSDWSFMLYELTGEKPDYEPERPVGPGFIKWNVRALADAWLKWGKEHGYEV